MKNTFFIALVVLLFSMPARSQDFSAVDHTVRAYSKSFSKPEELASKITSDFKREDEKARAIFTWIALNINYDLKSYYAQSGTRRVAYSFRTQAEKFEKEKQFRYELARKTLKSKKGVCEGYATLFSEVAGLVGLESVIVPGTSKAHPSQIGKLPGASDHAWNAVKIDGQWKLVDATWASGAMNTTTKTFVSKFNDGYFCTAPELFFLNHFPDDTRWLLTDLTAKDFAALPLYYGNYLTSGYTFLSPGIGTFTNSKSNVIPFRIQNLGNNDVVSYQFSRKNQSKEVVPVRSGNLSQFDIIMDNNSNGYLTVFVNQKSVVTYKIQR